EFQTVFARRIRERLDVAVIEVTTAVEDDLRDSLVLRLLGDRRTDGFRRCCIRPLGARVFVASRCGENRLAARVVDHLNVDVLQALEHCETRTGRRPQHLRANSLANPRSCFHSMLRAIHVVLYLPAALPALRRMTSSLYLMPLPL